MGAFASMIRSELVESSSRYSPGGSDLNVRSVSLEGMLIWRGKKI